MMKENMVTDRKRGQSWRQTENEDKDRDEQKMRIELETTKK